MAARTIMIQGTASNVGKSLLVAGLCRIFKQDGYRVAPFKSQNMALNSFITREGLEMGRAQVVQAEAAGIEASADMNPILLKPTGDSKSQVIVQGEIFDDMNAAAYYSYKKTFAPKVKESFGRLSAAYDIIVIEGAGSPVEINLKENDIVNMYMASLAGAPVILAGDIALQLVKSLCASRGIRYEIPGAGLETNFKAYKEQQYNALADSLRGNVDIKKIYSIIEEGLG